MTAPTTTRLASSALVLGGRIAGLVPLPAACAARADWLRDRAEQAGFRGQGNRDIRAIAYALAWDAHAASEYPRPMIVDAFDLAEACPTLAQTVWHHAAGATILGRYCCATPAAHRDALEELGNALRDSDRMTT